jgi:hypothetical protein
MKLFLLYLDTRFWEVYFRKAILQVLVPERIQFLALVVLMSDL